MDKLSNEGTVHTDVVAYPPPMPAPKRLTPKTPKRSQPTRDDDALTQRVRAALAEVPGVTEKRMFGSTGFLVRGKLCITSRDTRLMLRIDPADHDAALKREGCTTVLMKGREYRGYVFVAASSVKNARSLNSWLKKALDFNQRTFGKQHSAH
jgi:TfoX/Sxy family transcriptional regulator of competence genes